jgi:hypothetical protein
LTAAPAFPYLPGAVVALKAAIIRGKCELSRRRADLVSSGLPGCHMTCSCRGPDVHDSIVSAPIEACARWVCRLAGGRNAWYRAFLRRAPRTLMPGLTNFCRAIAPMLAPMGRPLESSGSNSVQADPAVGRLLGAARRMAARREADAVCVRASAGRRQVLVRRRQYG